MELTRNHLIYGIVGIILVVILYLVAFRPAPEFTTGCNEQCTDFIVDTDMYDNWTSALCGTGHDICCMEKVEYHIAGFKIYCTCCDCVEGQVTSDLGECNYGFFLFDWLAATIRLCVIG